MRNTIIFAAIALTLVGSAPLVADTAPSPGTVTPNPATGPSQSFTLTWSSTNGNTYTDISDVAVLFAPTITIANNCEVRYDQPSNSLYLLADTATTSSGPLLGPLTPGSGGTLSNSQCTVNGAGTTVSGSTSTLTLHLSITATASFVGTKNVYMWAVDSENSNSGWQQRGTWTPATNTAPVVGGVTPSPASGASQTFQLTWSTTNGKNYTDLVSAQVLFNYAISGVSSCYVYFKQPTNSLYLENDAGTGLLGPLTVGAAGTLSNSQCTVNGAGTTVSGSGPTLTLNLSVTASSGFLGTKNVYMWVQDSEGLNSGWQSKGTWTPIGPDTAPTVGTVSPNPANGNTTFTLTWSTANGKSYTDLIWAYVLFNSSLSGANACEVRYYQPTNSLYLLNDAGTGLLGPLTPGTTGTLYNSQCIVGDPATVSGSGATLTMTLYVQDKASFQADKNVYLWVQDSEGLNSGWQNRGVWSPLGPPFAEYAHALPFISWNDPTTGASPVFRLAWGDENGYSDIRWAEIRFNTSLSSVNGCEVDYFRPTNSLYLINDAGTARLGPVTPGSTATLSNSQCTVNAAGTSVSGSGKELVLTLWLTASSPFQAHNKTGWMWANNNEGDHSAWQSMAGWAATTSTTPPTFHLVTPNPASGVNPTLTATYVSQNGKSYTDLTWAYMLITGSTGSGANACYIRYYQPTNSLYLQNDANNASLGPLTPGSAGTLSNSQCTVNGTGTSVSGSGPALTLSVSVTAAANYVGTKYIYLWTVDTEGVNSTWIFSSNDSGEAPQGTWTPAN